MEFFKLTKRFKDDEDGAVTVDWVVLTAAIVGLGVAVLASVRTATIGLGDKIATAVDEQTVYTGNGGATNGGATNGGATNGGTATP